MDRCHLQFMLTFLVIFIPTNILATNLQQLTVTNTASSGSGSLRAAIDIANQTPGPALISFDQHSRTFAEPQTITLDADLPIISDDLEINGYIQDQLWKATGVTVNGADRYRLFRTAPGINLTLRYFTLSHGANNSGGAIESSGNTVVSAMLLMENRASQGGAIAQQQGSLTVINSTLLDNKGEKQGGAIYIGAGKARLTHVTVTANQSPQGAGVYSQGELAIMNSIIANNLGGLDCETSSSIHVDSGHNLIRTFKHCGKPLSSDDPQLGALNYYNGPTQTLPLSGSSPAVNFADNSLSLDENGSPLMWDQRGNGDPRDAAGIADIGAFEQQPVIRMEIDTTSDADLRFCTSAPADCSLRGAIMLANASDRHNRIGFDHRLFDGPSIALEYLSPLPPVTQPLELFSGKDKQVFIDLKKGRNAFLGNNLIKLKNVIIK